MTAAIQWTTHRQQGHESTCGHYRIKPATVVGYYLTVDNVEIKRCNSLSLLLDYTDILHEVRHDGPPAELVRAARHLARDVSAPDWTWEALSSTAAAEQRAIYVGAACRAFCEALRACETAPEPCPLLDWARALSTAYASADSAGALYLWAELVGQRLIAGPPTEG